MFWNSKAEFRRVGFNSARHKELGYRVKILNRNVLLYTTDSNEYAIEIEPGENLAVYANTLMEKSDHDSIGKIRLGKGEQVSPEKSKQLVSRITEAIQFSTMKIEPNEKQEIISRISRALDFLKIQHQVQY